MGRRPEPWYWDERKAWYVTIDGKRHRLAEKKNDAFDEFHTLMTKRHQPVSVGSVWAVLDEFLDWTEDNRAPRTYDFYHERLQQFKDAVPNMPVETLSPTHVYAWMKGKAWSNNYKRGVMTSLCRSFNWAAKARMISFNPIKGIEKPPETFREQIITPKQFKELLGFVNDEEFSDLLKIIWWTGCRPQEIVAVEARHLQNGYWEFPKDESKGKRHERQVFLTDRAFKLCRKWAKRNPKGPIFRNTRGRPWTAYAFNNRFQRLKEKIGYKLCMYALRHSYAHHAITTGGLSLEETAALLGHTSTQMIYKVYGKLRKNKMFMRAAAKRAVSAR